MTQQYLIGELSVRLEQLQATTADGAAQDCGGRKFRNVRADVDQPLVACAARETEATRWFTLSELATLLLHPAVHRRARRRTDSGPSRREDGPRTAVPRLAGRSGPFPVALRCVSRQDQRRLSGQQPKRVNISAVLLAKPAGGRFQFRTLTALLGREPGDFRHRHLEGEAELIRFFRCGCVTPGRPAVRRTRQAGAASARMALGRSAAANLQDQRDRRQLRCHGERGHRAEGYVEQHPDHHASQHPCCAVDPCEQPVG
jgi:hypothetical protein